MMAQFISEFSNLNLAQGVGSNSSNSTSYTKPCPKELPAAAVQKIAQFVPQENIAHVNRSFAAALIDPKPLLYTLANHNWNVQSIDESIRKLLLLKGRMVKELNVTPLQSMLCDDAFQAIGECFPCLESLKVEVVDAHVTISDDATKWLRHLPLRKLSLINTGVSENCLVNFAKMPLEDFAIDSVILAESPFKHLEGMKLTKLSLSSCVISTYAAERLRNFPLQSLNLASARLSNKQHPVRCLQGMKLQTLFVSNVSDKHMPCLKDLPLKHLSIVDSEDLTDMGLTCLAGKKIISMAIVDCPKITGLCLKYLQDLPLRYLNLSETSVGKDGKCVLHPETGALLEKMKLLWIKLPDGEITTSAKLRLLHKKSQDGLIEQLVRMHLSPVFNLKDMQKKEQMVPEMIRRLHAIFHKKFPERQISEKEFETRAWEIDLKDFVSVHVQNHLNPYISKTITEKTENTNRAPLIEELFELCKKRYSSNYNYTKEGIRSFALGVYVHLAARAHVASCKMHMDGSAMEALDFLNMLVDAVSIDFKDMALDPKEIRRRGATGLTFLFSHIQTKP